MRPRAACQAGAGRRS